MYPQLKLGELTDADVPEWAGDLVEEVYDAVTEEEIKPGEEDRKHFKLLRREKIKAENERKSMGV